MSWTGEPDAELIEDTWVMGMSRYSGELPAATGKILEGQMQGLAFTDLPARPGYSGSPVMNTEGQALGMLLGEHRERPGIFGVASFGVFDRYIDNNDWVKLVRTTE